VSSSSPIGSTHSSTLCGTRTTDNKTEMQLDVACSAEHGPGPGVRREAAHNLALIYQKSGAPNLARNVLRAHFTV
jgi:hypothetical protein